MKTKAAVRIINHTHFLWIIVFGFLLLNISSISAEDNKSSDVAGDVSMETEYGKIQEKIEQRRLNSEKENAQAMGLFYKAAHAVDLSDLFGGIQVMIEGADKTSGMAEQLYKISNSATPPLNALCGPLRGLDKNSECDGGGSNGSYEDTTDIRVLAFNACMGRTEKYGPRLQESLKERCIKSFELNHKPKYAFLVELREGPGNEALESFKEAPPIIQNVHKGIEENLKRKYKVIKKNNRKAEIASGHAQKALKWAMDLLNSRMNDNYKITGAARDRKINKSELGSVYNLSDRPEDVMNKNFDLLSITTAAATDFECERLNDVDFEKAFVADSISYFLFKASSAIYLAEHIRIRTDYVQNQNAIINMAETIKQAGNQQRDLIQQAVYVRSETQDFAGRLQMAKENVREMFQWVDQVSVYEYKCKRASVLSGGSNYKAAQAAKRNLGMKDLALSLLEQLDGMRVSISGARKAACCGGSFDCCQDATDENDKAVKDKESLKDLIKTSKGEVDKMKERSKGCAGEMLAAGLQTDLICKVPKEDEKVIIPATSSSIPKVKNWLEWSKITSTISAAIEFISPIASAYASHFYYSALGMARGTSVFDFFIEAKIFHARLVAGLHKNCECKKDGLCVNPCEEYNDDGSCKKRVQCDDRGFKFVGHPIKAAYLESRTRTRTGGDEAKVKSKLEEYNTPNYNQLGFPYTSNRVDYTWLLKSLGEVVVNESQKMTRPSLTNDTNTYGEIADSMSGNKSAVIGQKSGSTSKDATGNAIQGGSGDGPTDAKGVVADGGNFGHKNFNTNASNAADGKNTQQRRVLDSSKNKQSGYYVGSSGIGTSKSAIKLADLRKTEERELKDFLEKRTKGSTSSSISGVNFRDFEYDPNAVSVLKSIRGKIAYNLAKKPEYKLDDLNNSFVDGFGAGYRGYSLSGSEATSTGKKSGKVVYESYKRSDNVSSAESSPKSSKASNAGSYRDKKSKTMDTVKSDQTEYDKLAWEYEKKLYETKPHDSIWEKVTKTYKRIGYPVLLKEKK